VRPAALKNKLAKRLNSRRFRMAFCSTIPRSCTQDFHFDLPDGVSYTPNTYQVNQFVFPRLIFQLARPPSPVRVDIRSTGLPFRSIFSDTAPQRETGGREVALPSLRSRRGTLRCNHVDGFIGDVPQCTPLNPWASSSERALAQKIDLGSPSPCRLFLAQRHYGIHRACPARGHIARNQS